MLFTHKNDFKLPTSIPGWLAKVLFSDVRWLFAKKIEQTKHKETSKLCITGPLCIESFGDPLIPQTKGQ